MTYKILTKKQLEIFFHRYGIPNPNKPGEGRLTANGARTLLRACFNVNNNEPEYPLHKQPENIQDCILALLETNPFGKFVLDELVNSIIIETLFGSIKVKP